VCLAKKIHAPSKATSSVLTERLDNNVRITKWAIEALKSVSSSNVDERAEACAHELLAKLERVSKQQDDTGLAGRESSVHTKGEIACSSVVAEACTRHFVGDRLSSLHWYHQLGTTDGVPDILVTLEDESKIQPVAVIEFGFIGDNKKWQCLAYGINLTWSVEQLLECKDVPILAMTWALDRDHFNKGRCELHVVGANPYAAAAAKFSASEVWAGDVSAANVALLLRTIVETASKVAAEASTSTQEKWAYYGPNVAICEGRTGAKIERSVFKLFDYRQSIRGKVEQAQRRNFELTQSKLNATRIVDAPDLVVLQYKYVKGLHYATDTHHFVAAITELRSMQDDEDLVHADIRACNMLFNTVKKTKKKKCTFLDYDFASKLSDKRKYPRGFVSSGLPDVTRHDDARAGKMLAKEHDWFALASVMRMHAHSDARGWQHVCELTASGDHQRAIAAISKLEGNTDLTASQNLRDLSDADRATGSPDERRGRRRRSAFSRESSSK